MINVLIADDHQLFIDGIRSALKGVLDIWVVAEAANGYQVLEKLNSGIPIDIILMDINMPMLDGLACTKMVRRKYPEIKVIALSQFAEKRFVKQMIKNGAAGYLLKDCSKDMLVNAITKVYNGEGFYFNVQTSRLIKAELSSENNQLLFPKLSERELEILHLIGQEFSTQEIAEKLGVSFHTVESHRANMINKIGVRNTAGLIKWAVENDLID